MEVDAPLLHGADSCEGEDCKAQFLEDAVGLNPRSMEVTLSESVYSAQAVMGLLGKHETWKEWIEICFFQYVIAVFNFWMQFTFVMSMRRMVHDAVQNVIGDDADCRILNPTLLVLVLTAFVLYLIQDIQETMYMATLFWRLIPTISGQSKLRFKAADDGSMELVEAGFSRCRKIVVTFTVLVPKLLIAVGLGLIGCRYLMVSATNEDLLMNGLALVFVLDMDEMLYAAITPCCNKRLLSSLPAFTGPPDCFWNMWWTLGPVIKISSGFLVMQALFRSTPRCGSPDGGLVLQVG